MTDSPRSEMLRNFRKTTTSNGSDSKQGSILRFVRRPSQSSSTNSSSGSPNQSSNGLFTLTSSSPKVSTIVVRKPSGSFVKNDSSETTSKAFSKFNTSSFYTKSATPTSTNGGAVGTTKLYNSSPTVNSSTAKSKIVFIEHPSSVTYNGNSTISSPESPLVRFNVVRKGRIIDSSDEDDGPPNKRIRLDEEAKENVLCKDFTEEPTDLIDYFIDSLHSMFTDYDRMELMDALKDRKYNFNETAKFLEQEDEMKKEMLESGERKERKDALRMKIEKNQQLLKQVMETKANQIKISEIKLREQRQLKKEKAEEALQRALQMRMNHEQTKKLNGIDEKERKKIEKKTIHRAQLQSKKNKYKILASKSFFNEVEDEDEEVYIGKSNVYFSDDSEDEGETNVITADIITMRGVVLNFFNDSTEQEICAINGCSKKKAEIIVGCRPFSNWDKLVEVMKSEKHINPELLNNVKNVLQKRRTVNTLMKKCESISGQIQDVVSGLVDGEETEGAIGKQPALLNPEMKLKNYQMVGLNWLSLMHQQGLNGVLADEMGLGKTVQAISFLAHLSETVETEKLSLIVVPSSTLNNWARELELWCPKLVVLMYHGSQEERRGMRMQIINNELDENTQIILTTYNMVYSSSEDRAMFKRVTFHTVIFDEAHMLKNMNSQRFENLMKIRAECRVLLTGTPLQNNLVELMSILVFVMPDLFEGKKDELKQVFSMFPKAAEEKDKGQYEAKRIEQAKRIMKPFFLRRLKDDVLKDLPKKTEEAISIILTSNQRQLYDETVQQLSKKAQELKDVDIELKHLTELEELAACEASLGEGGKKEKKEDSTSGMLMILRKIANHPLLHRNIYDDKMLLQMAKILKKTTHQESIVQYIVEDFSVMSDFEIHKTCLSLAPIRKFKLEDELLLESGKFAEFDKLLPQMKQKGDRVLIFSQFVIVLNIMEEYMRLRGYKFMRLDGQTPVSERQEMIDEFNEDPEIFIFLLSTRAGGLGINLTSANTVILHDIDFNPYNDKQAEDRCHRVGQVRPVKIIRFIAKDTIEEGMRAIALGKLDLEKEVTGLKDEGQKKSDVQALLKTVLGIHKTD